MSGLRECQTHAYDVVRHRISQCEKESNLSLCTGAGKTRIIQELIREKQRCVLIFPWLPLLIQFWNDKRNPLKTIHSVYYLATEGTLPNVKKIHSVEDLSSNTNHLIVLTTYASAPVLYEMMTDEHSFELIIHDEAHHLKAPQYKAAFELVSSKFAHTVNLSATLACEPNDIHYKYSLLRGIKDKVVRDFRANIFLCTKQEREHSSVIVQIVKQLLLAHEHVKLLIYTREAETDADDSSSVRTFMTTHANTLTEEGWWIRGINSDTIQDKDKLLREFQKDREVSILVSCKTLSEGVDLRNANCMMAWDATKSTVDNIQRIGRVLRKYKDADGNDLEEELQTPSTVMIPVFLDKEKYEGLGGNRKNIHDALCEEIGQNINGNFMHFISVMAALKSELADEDEELMTQLLNYPPRVKVCKGIAECVGKKLKKKASDILDEAAQLIEDEYDDDDGMFDEETSDDEEECLTFADRVRQGEWDEEEAEDVANAIAKSQNIQLVITESDEVSRYGEGGQQLFVEKQGETYKALSNSKKATEASKKHFKDRMRVTFSGECEIMLGLNDYDCIDGENNFVMRELTMEVDGDRAWEKRKQEAIEFQTTHKFIPNVCSQTEEARKIGQWIADQRKRYKRNKLTTVRITLLEKIEWWYWTKDKEDEWDKSKSICNSYVIHNKHIPSQHSSEPEELKLANWITVQRRNYKNNRLSIRRIQSLERLDWWFWNRYDHKDEEWITMKNKFIEIANSSSTKKDKELSNWINRQRSYYVQGKLSQEKIKELEDIEIWCWKDNKDERWETNKQNAHKFWKDNNRIASGSSKNNKEKALGAWICQQRGKYKQGKLSESHIKSLEKLEWWLWEVPLIRNEKGQLVSGISNTVSPVIPPQNTIVKVKRQRLVIKPKDQIDAEKKAQHREQVKNQMTEYHKRFKHMKHENFAKHMQENPQEWHDYHAIADEHDDRDREDQKPNNVIISKFLSRYKNRPSYRAIDLGCGQDRLRRSEGVDKICWESVDVVAANDSVTIADMGTLPYEDEEFDVAVMNRSLWATDREKVLGDAYRVLKFGGRLFVCEAWGKWHKEDGMRLPALVEKSGFVVKQMLGDGQEEGGEFGCWFYLECVKE